MPGCQYGSTSCIFHNSEGDGGFGEIDVSTALTVSSDDFFYNLGAMFWDDSSRPDSTGRPRSRTRPPSTAWAS